MSESATVHRPDCGVPSGRTFACSCASTVRDTATVTVSEAVDGTKRRRRPKGHRPHQPKRAIDTHEIVVDPRVMAAAKALVTPYTRLVIVDAECVRIVNR